MDKRTSLKRTLLLSVMAMLICAAMLAGTTFAWFTDSASTGVNKIAAGNLDIELEYSYDMVTWKNATADTKLFNDGALWEPGHTELVYLRIANKGSLALKYETEFGYNYRVTRGKSVLGNYYLSGFVTCPLDVIKTRIQTQASDSTVVTRKYTGFWQTFKLMLVG